jgi:HK97 family phage major capsid protein
MDLNKKLSDAREKGKELRLRGAALSALVVAGTALTPEQRAEMGEIETKIGECETIITDVCRALKIGAFSDNIGPVGLNANEVRNFSMLKLINYLAKPDDKNLRASALMEIEASEAVAKMRGLTPQGAFLPVELMGSWGESGFSGANRRQRRDLNVTTGSQGGNLVATVMMPGIIELLRNRLALAAAGITVIDGLVGDVAFPKQTGAATAYWVSPEGGAPTESQQAVGQVTMTPKTIGAFTDFTRNFRMQSSIGAEMFVRDDLSRVLALGIDLAGLMGSGAAGQPSGLNVTANVGAVAHSTNNAPTWAEIVEMRSAVNQDNADVGSVASITDSTMVGTLMTTKKDAGSGIFIVPETGDSLMGRPLIESNQVTDGDIWYGVWSQLLLGMWGMLDILVDPFTHSSTGTTRVVALQSVDFACRHPEAFCKAT